MLYFPLEKVTDSQLQRLFRTLWSWAVCEDCQNCKRCVEDDCPWQRTKRLVPFIEHYKDLTAAYEPDIRPGERPALLRHEDIFEIIQLLKSEPDIVRCQLTERLFVSRHCRASLSAADLDYAVNLAVRVMTMVNCSAKRQSATLLEYGLAQIPWRSDVSFSQFITDIFPTTDHPGLNNDGDTDSPLNIRTALTAKKLMKRAGLKFQATDDLRCHLKLDRKKDVVHIYHHTAFLKEHLRLTKDKARNIPVSDSLKFGALPRQLALEALDSIQKVLFPLSDPKSHSLLQSLTSTSHFDPDCLRFESASIRTADEKDIAYHYFGARLADLYEELENPKPRGWIEKWLERKSGARYVMMATLTGVVIAILLGMASLAVGIYQAWLGYQQWQHPIGSAAYNTSHI
ncbi:hypothetical protein MMC27_005964 [Xylographa pallens]|nr:hypothetical protein [Xylographa pallens]